MILLGLLSCSVSFADITVHQSVAPSATMAWSDAQANQLLSNDQPAAQVTVQIQRTESKPRTSGTVLNNSTVANKYPTTANNYNTARAGQPNVSARAAIVMDAQTGEVLYGKNTSSTVPIASITKLMTAVITADARLNMSEKITLQPIDFAGAGGKNSSSTLRAGDTLNRAEVLLLALMKSENPAAAALARTYPGGRPAFVAAMNAKARQLGMTSTHYVESTGLDPSNVSSARDLAILVSSASQYGLIRQFSTTAHYDFNLGYRVLKSNNTNALVRNGAWNINISKTGYINEAGRCVVMSATVNQRPAVIVLLGASSTVARNNDATNLLNWLSSGITTL
ncbi:D-alanyl-D-alanine endopeptidase [Acinetobacter qingfengensis]|uniref:D-alanyl-D-alanine endopeptidase n=1 Tax=Acinetobacter qingfengensis TaxID=1262585 RepID=A0A1E7R1J2_9GAMM|nr:D-alanyl-D-alanine endopeptidase [Acinetobacter qingfengensis]